MNHRGEFYNPLGRISALLRLRRPAADDALVILPPAPRPQLGSTLRPGSSPPVDRGTPPAKQAIDGSRMALGVFALVETVVLHAAFGPGIGHSEPGLVAAHLTDLII